ncbi:MULTISPECIES: hypothetical protein [Corallococcus]|uniref:hypothetical protein n=1 Tax=Corallococcus TaxID=83461 RepID=UPI00118109DA|nr:MULTISPECIES: hypothetical protein [Corallococcus]NBD07350.1 hypothetical protein [Corallococcus silvisoli]TSC22924.1 hypothetical protein FOF48_31625 [Corallococcus sp. Z5C101001]
MSRNRVLFSLCLAGALLGACASVSRSSSDTARSEAEPVQPCASSPDAGTADVVVDITADSDGKVHFSSKTVKVEPGQTVVFVSQVQQDRCIGVSDASLFKEGAVNPLPVPACQSASWTLRNKDAQGQHSLWSCATSDCSKCTQPQGITETINGTLEVTGRGED